MRKNEWKFFPLEVIFKYFDGPEGKIVPTIVKPKIEIENVMNPMPDSLYPNLL